MSTENLIQIIGQGIGIVAFIISCSRYFLRKKKDIIKISIISYMIYIVHYFLIGALAGSYSLIISLFRDLYLYQREKHKKYRHRKIYNNAFVFIAFFSIYFFMMLINLNQPKNILTLLAGLVYFCFKWFTTNKTTIKIAGSVTNIPWLIYDILSLSFAGITADAISFIVAFAGVTKDKRRKNRSKHHVIMKKSR